MKLEVLQTKASIALLRGLFHTIEMLGGVKPKVFRTDNEAVFTSWRFRLGLVLLRIKHQRTKVCCPWQNGKIERFFGTLKAQSKNLIFSSGEILRQELNTFRFWYNHLRPHQHLNGKTPAEVWAGTDLDHRKPKTPYWFEAWDGLVTGFYIPP